MGEMGRMDRVMNRSARFLVVCALVLLTLGDVSAALRLPNVFGDHMVLQRDKPVRVWGWADAGAEVKVKFGKAEVGAKADENGKWSCSLPAMPANFEGAEMVVTSGGESVTLKDVLVGEVWLCGGQSNMEWTLRGTRDADMEIDSADSPMIRFLRLPKVAAGSPQDDFVVPEGNGHTGRWQQCIPEQVQNCTAVGYYFAVRLQRRLKVPVGLIDTSWGGTMSQFWVSQKTLRPMPEMKGYLADHEKAVREWQEGGREEGAKKRFEVDMAAWEKKRKAAEAAGEKAPGGRPNSRSYTDPETRAHPGGLYNGVLMPVAPFTIRGALCYQGENNSFGESWKPFPKTYPAVVGDWRKAFENKALPVGLIQIAGWSTRRSMSYDMNHHTNVVREVQHLTWQNTPGTGLIVSFDANSDGNIHPRRKRPVGERCARWALAEVYGIKRHGSGDPLEWRGPVCREATFADGKVTISFVDGTARGLRLDKDVDLGFYIAGKDKVFHIARARVVGQRGKDGMIEVWAENVPEPVAVRYAVSNLPMGSLMNGMELPAYPFRTDKWPITPHQSTGNYIAE